jgi:hypothetical protein
MQQGTQNSAASKKMFWAGCVISALPVLLMLGTGLFGLINADAVARGLSQYGYPKSIALRISLLELACIIVYAVPQTAVLGAILVTAYLGGATATHVRAGEPFFSPVITGVLVWAGLFLRDQRLRTLIPLRK